MEIDKFLNKLKKLLEKYNQQENEYKALKILRDFINSEFFKTAKKDQLSVVYLTELANMPGFPVDFFQTLDNVPPDVLEFMEEWKLSSVFHNREVCTSENLNDKENPYLIPIHKMVIAAGNAYHIDKVVEDLKEAEKKDLNNEEKTFTVDMNQHDRRVSTWGIKPDTDIFSYTKYSQLRVSAALKRHPAIKEVIAKTTARDAELAEKAMTSGSVNMPEGWDKIPSTTQLSREAAYPTSSSAKMRLPLLLPNGEKSSYEANVSSTDMLNYFFKTHYKIMEMSGLEIKGYKLLVGVLACLELCSVQLKQMDRYKKEYPEDDRCGIKLRR